MELKAKELRIGNYLNYQGKIIKVEGIHNRTIYHSDRQFDQVGVEKYITFEPIPLTEEWLLRFGYTEKDLSQGKIIKGRNGGYIITTLSNKEIFYVHKLQNLYYELKDNELKLIK